MKRLCGLCAAFVVVITLSACSPLEPWVKPYERAALADEVMSNDRHPTVAAYGDHIHEVREAAHGATGGSGGGCGCN
jgi:hypothetical protein